MANSYDAIVIGAGSIGVPCALALAERKVKTLVLDAAASPGQGQNKAAIGGIRATHSDGAKIKTCLKSLEIFSTWQSKHGDDIGWRKGGYLFPAYNESDEAMMRAALKTQKGFGLNIGWVDKTAVQTLAPGITEENLRGGTYSPDDGSASPLLAMRAFYKKAAALGAEFKFNERVAAVEIKNGKVTGVKTGSGRYCARVVVNAAGAAAKSIGLMAGVELPISPDTHEAGITEPAARMFDPMIVDIRAEKSSKNYYFYQNAEGQIVFCLTPLPPIWGAARESTSTFLPTIARRMIALMPKLANIKVRRTWRGLYPMTPDGFPIVDEAPGAEGFFTAGGMCGQGFMLGPGIGQLLAEAATKTISSENKKLLGEFSSARSFTEMEQFK